jgi:hypothetical protein
MSVFDDARSVERPRFFDGQRLLATDLDGITAFHRALRWLHNRSLHQAGVGNGFAVSGSRGEREVRIQPGYALDAEGREIVLLDTAVEAVPPVAGEPAGGPTFFDLVVSYPSDDDLEEAETRAGVCEPRGAIALRERPVFCWVHLVEANGRLRPLDEAQALQIQNGLALVLARAEVLECQLNADLTVAVRRTARPPERPRLACGTTPVEWTQWPEQGEVAYGLTAAVDTRAGRFRQTPRYAARVEGIRPLAVAIPDTDAMHALDLPAFVQDARPQGFVCYVPVVDLQSPGTLASPLPTELLAAARAAWQVTWLGIED